MKIAGRLLLALVLMGGLIMAGCEGEDGGTTDPLPNPIPSGDITVQPDSTGSMAPLSSAVQAASPGFVIVLMPGGYSGTLVIDKPLTFVSSAGKDNTILTNETDTTTVVVQISGSFSSTDSLVFDGLGFNSGGRGIHVETSTVPIAVRKCDVFDNATVGIQIGDASGKAGGDPTLIIWQSFFRRNGTSGTEPWDSAAIWSTTTVTGASVFFEANVVDIALTSAALANLERVTSSEARETSLYLEGASEMTLDGIDSTTPTTLRDGEQWAAQVFDSVLSIRNYRVQRFDSGGFELANSSLSLEQVTVEDVKGYGVYAMDSEVELDNSGITGTDPDDPGTFALGFGIWAESTDSATNSLILTDSTIGDAFRGGIQALGVGQTVTLVNSTLEENGTGWRERVIEDDPTPPVGGGLGLFDEATAVLTDTSLRLNFAVKGGGLAVIGPGANAEISGGEIRSNSADELGAGILLDGASGFIENAEVRSNSAGGFGGGMAVVEGALFQVINTPIESNSANHGGGGAYVFRGEASFSSGSSFVGNLSIKFGNGPFGEGGGIHLNQATAQLDNTTFEANVGDLGGALFATTLDRDIAIRGCVFSNNRADQIAGAVYATDLTRELRLEGCQFYGNSIKLPVAAVPSTIYSRQDLPGGRLMIQGCTVVNNFNGAGAIGHRSGEMSVTETVVAFNIPAGIVGNDLQFVDMSCNDFWNNGDLDYGPGADPGPGSINEDPLFCDRAGSVFTVDSASPLLPGNNGCGVLIGARGQGCAAKQ